MFLLPVKKNMSLTMKAVVLFLVATFSSASTFSFPGPRLWTFQPFTNKQEVQPRELKQGMLIEAELAGDKTHSYLVDLGAGQFLKVSVAQKGLDVKLRVFAPDG